MDRPTQPDAPAATANQQDRPAAAAGAAWPRATLALGLAALAAAYHELFWYAPGKSLSDEIEQLFFMPSQSVAPLVLLLSAWLLYRRVGWLRSLPHAPAPGLGWGLLGAGASLHVWATLTSAPDLLVPSLGLAGFGIAAMWKGRAGVRAVLVPVLFLLFAMPLPAPLLGELIYRLQIATADLTGALLSLLRIPHHVAGEQILRTNQTFSVIETCSGLRSIETLTMVAILMADLFGRVRLHALLLVAAAPPVAFFLNGWRAVTLILNPHSEIVAVHNLQGVAILLGGLVLLYLFDGALEKFAPALGAGTERQTPAGRPAAAKADGGGPASPGLAGAALLLGALAAASLVLPRFDAVPPEGLQLSSRLASGVGDLFSEEVATDRVFLGSAGFLESVTRRFQRDGRPVDVFVGVGWRPGRARSPLSPKTALPGSGWILESEQIRALEPDARPVRNLLFRSDTHTVLAYHWYEGSAGLGAETWRSFAALDASPLRRPEEIIAVRITTEIEGPVASGLGPAAARLDAFYAELRPVLDSLERRLQQSAGKSFPQFSRMERIFSGSGADPIPGSLPDRILTSATRLGMPLANEGAEARKPGSPAAGNRAVRPPRWREAGARPARKTLEQRERIG